MTVDTQLCQLWVIVAKHTHTHTLACTLRAPFLSLPSSSHSTLAFPQGISGEKGQRPRYLQRYSNSVQDTCQGYFYFKDLLELHLKVCGVRDIPAGLVKPRRQAWGQGMHTAFCLWVSCPVKSVLVLPAALTGLKTRVQRHPSKPADLLLGNLWQTRLIHFLNSSIKGS